MYFTSTLLAAVLATASVAAPTPAVQSQMATGTWTIQAFTRTCNAADTSCNYSFTVNPNDGTKQLCTYTVTGAPASRATKNPAACGAYQISSQWSGQFGPTNGFTTFAVVKGRQIIYPAYSDREITNGKAASPDKSYTPQNLP